MPSWPLAPRGVRSKPSDGNGFGNKEGKKMLNATVELFRLRHERRRRSHGGEPDAPPYPRPGSSRRRHHRFFFEGAGELLILRAIVTRFSAGTRCLPSSPSASTSSARPRTTASTAPPSGELPPVGQRALMSPSPRPGNHISRATFHYYRIPLPVAE